MQIKSITLVLATITHLTSGYYWEDDETLMVRDYDDSIHLSERDTDDLALQHYYVRRALLELELENLASGLKKRSMCPQCKQTNGHAVSCPHYVHPRPAPPPPPRPNPSGGGSGGQTNGDTNGGTSRRRY